MLVMTRRTWLQTVSMGIAGMFGLGSTGAAFAKKSGSGLLCLGVREGSKAEQKQFLPMVTK